MSENKEYVTQIQGQSNVHISQEAICTVAAMAAVEVDGVAGLSNLGSDIAGIAGKKNLSRAIRLRSEEDALSIDLSLLVKFGMNIQTVAKNVQDAVRTSVESVIGLQVASVTVQVSGVAFEKEAMILGYLWYPGGLTGWLNSHPVFPVGKVFSKRRIVCIIYWIRDFT